MKRAKTLRERYAELLRLRIAVLEAEHALLTRSMFVHERRTPQSTERDEGPND